MKDMFVTGRFLFVVCAVAALALAATEQITAPRIAALKVEEMERAKKQALPAAATFVDLVLPVTLPDGSSASKTVFIGYDQDKNIIGVVQTGSSKGYAGPINLVVGLDTELKMVNLKVATPNETPGLGTKLKEEDFLNKFFAQCQALGAKMVYALKKDQGNVDGITAATISSRAFCRGIQEMVDFARENQERIFKGSGPAPTPPPAPALESPPAGTVEVASTPVSVPETGPESTGAPRSEADPTPTATPSLEAVPSPPEENSTGAPAPDPESEPESAMSTEGADHE